MYFRKIAVFALLLMFLASVFPLQVSGSEERVLDRETSDRLRETYDLEIPDSSSSPMFEGDWGTSNPAGLALDLVYTALYPLPSIVQKIVYFHSVK
ncbi:hypothetical protein [Paenibacillus faecalis]|uniref:hypothetical protein n=1 Tax=Paenibacillus faecalis TaxID=2079532 RepID=UPI000D0E4DE5|nr:hypothetical protein [Paenibacillus faecalis]